MNDVPVSRVMWLEVLPLESAGSEALTQPVGWTDRKRPMNESGEREREERQPEEIRFLAGWTFRGWVQCNAASHGLLMAVAYIKHRYS